MSSSPLPDDTAPRPKRRRRRWWIALAVILLGLIAWAGITLALAAGPMRAGRAALLEARRALVAGDLSVAGDRFATASAGFARARDRAIWGPGFIPFVGNSTDAVVAIAEAGEDLGAAGTTLVGGLQDLPGGISALAPSGGTLPIDAYASLAGTLAEAREDANAAAATAAAAPEGYLLGPIEQARWDAESQTAELAITLDAATGLLEGLPRFAGAEGTRRYLVLASNPAELRGAGGLWGAYAILTLRDGRVSLSEAAPTQSLPDLSADEIEGVDPEYREIYDRFGGASSWQNMNMTPDFPSAAAAAVANLAAGGDHAVDGVIAADPFAMRSFLRVTGPATVPGTQIRVNADNVVPFTTNEAFALFDTATERKVVLGAVASDVLSTFLSMQGQGLPRLRAIGQATGGGHLMLYSTDAAFQEALVAVGAAGAFERPASADLFAVTVNNGSGNKVDFYAERDVDVSIELGGDHEALGTMEVTIANPAPTEGVPPYVLGPIVEGLGPGDQYPLISSWCPEPCELIQARRDGAETLVNTGTENGMVFFRDYRPIPAGGEGTYGVSWHTRDVWTGDTWDGRYRLTIAGQTTIVPTEMTVSITAPPGAMIAWTSEPMEVEGDVAVWSGTPGPSTVLEIRFRSAFPTRWWRTLTGG